MISMSATSPFFCAPRILVVDDVTEDRLLLADFLRQRGYRLYVGKMAVMLMTNRLL